MKKINEIFYSLQGEGRNAGKPAVFIRFSGCNIKCPFCDTKHNDGTYMTNEQIVSEVKKYPASLVILTGGEPSLFADNNLIRLLKLEDKIIAMETNGTSELKCNPDFITLSPKIEFVNKRLVLKECNELKVIYNGKNDMRLYDLIKADYYYIQPCDTGNETENKNIIKKSVEFCLQNPKWNLSLQTQKILKIQ